MKYITIAISIIVFCSSCTEKQSFDLPEHIKEIENLTVYNLEGELSRQVQFKEEQVFGNDESQLDGLIGQLWDVAVDNSGRVYIADPQEMNIKIYEPNGQFLTALGRRGQGPGELQALASIQIEGNHLFVFDRNQQVIVVFRLDTLEYDHTINIANNRDQYDDVAGAFLNNVYIRNDRSFLKEFAKGSLPENIVDWDKFAGKEMYYLLDSDGNIVSQKLFETKSMYQVLVPLGGRKTGMPVEFFGKPITALSSDGHIFHAWSQDFLVKVFSPEGEYERAFYYPIKGIPLEPEIAFDTGSDELVQRAIREIDFPDSWPVVNDLLTDDENRIWASTILPNLDSYEWWIMEESGELITKFEWPRDKPIEEIRNGFMYTRETIEESGEEQLVRYKILMSA